MKTSFVFLSLQLMLILLFASCSLNVDSSQDTAEIVLIGDNGTISPKGVMHVTLDSVVSPEVSPLAGYSFKQWDISGNIEVIGSLTNPQSSLRVKGDGTVTAMFEKEKHVLTIKESDCGTITKSPDSTSYQYDAKVTLTATPNVGYKFTGWSGDLTGMTNSVSVSVTNNKTITATFAPIPSVTGVVYVRKEATGLNDGSSWVNAYTDLGNAFTVSGADKTYWVAGGEYRVSDSSIITSSFTPQTGSQIYGGFSGFESALSQRVWFVHPTIIHGGNDLSKQNYLFILKNTSNVRLNGFVFERTANACIAVMSTANLTVIENCIMRNNVTNVSASFRALHIAGSNTTVNSCVFYNNRGNSSDGHAITISTGANSFGTKIVNCLLTDNNGPAIANATTAAPGTEIINCTIVNNATPINQQAPGGVSVVGAAIALRGCILWGNTTPRTTGTQIDSAAEIKFCCIQNGLTDNIGVLRRSPIWNDNNELNPTFNTTVVPVNIADWYSSNDVVLPLLPGNIALKNNVTFTISKPAYDTRGAGRPANFDFGAYETQFVAP